MILWRKYISKQSLSCLFFCLISFFTIYVIIDLSVQFHSFVVSGKFIFSKALIYYANQFLKKLPILLPFAWMISLIRTLSNLNLHRELVALQVAGLSLKKIITPLWIITLACCLTGLVNQEYLIPISSQKVTALKETLPKNPLKKQKKRKFTLLHLEDGSKLVYQKFDEPSGKFFDVFWIRSWNDFWRIKLLNLDVSTPIGEYVDHIIRNEDGCLEKKESYEKCLLPSLKLSQTGLNKKQFAIKNKKISTLIKTSKDSDSFHTQGELLTCLFHKISSSFYPLLIFLGVVPFCVRYSRAPPIFFIYTIASFCFIVFFTLMNAMLILGENQILPPIIICLPLILSIGVCFFNFYSLE